MPDSTALFGDLRAAEVLAWMAALTVVIAGVVVILRKALPLLKKLGDFLDDVAGEPARAGVPARPGLMERVQRIEHEMFPNSGKSLRDQTDRLEGKLDTHIDMCIGLEKTTTKGTS